MTDHKNWPHIYRVTLRGISGEKRVDTVLSWLNEHKAVAMAVEVHYGGWWAAKKKTWPVYSVEVDDLSAAPADEDGTVGEGPRGTLLDRAEF
jgi:hypothetical protein